MVDNGIKNRNAVYNFPVSNLTKGDKMVESKVAKDKIFKESQNQCFYRFGSKTNIR